jgi:hypothetical protein
MNEFYNLLINGGFMHASSVPYQAVGRLGLAAATAFNAVNYLDRFLSINCHLVTNIYIITIHPSMKSLKFHLLLLFSSDAS